MAKKKAITEAKKSRKTTVAKGVKLKQGTLEDIKKKPGSSSAGRYKKVNPKDFAGAAGGASKYSFPINNLARGRNALARAHYAPNPEGIRNAVYKRYHGLKKRAMKRKK